MENQKPLGCEGCGAEGSASLCEQKRQTGVCPDGLDKFGYPTGTTAAQSAKPPTTQEIVVGWGTALVPPDFCRKS